MAGSEGATLEKCRCRACRHLQIAQGLVVTRNDVGAQFAPDARDFVVPEARDLSPRAIEQVGNVFIAAQGASKRLDTLQIGYEQRHKPALSSCVTVFTRGGLFPIHGIDHRGARGQELWLQDGEMTGEQVQALSNNFFSPPEVKVQSP
jgi:hypothetical protein